MLEEIKIEGRKATYKLAEVGELVFLLDVIEDERKYMNFWLYEKNSGIKEYMVGMPLEYNGVSHTWEENVNSLKNFELLDIIRDYYNTYVLGIDCED